MNSSIPRKNFLHGLKHGLSILTVTLCVVIPSLVHSAEKSGAASHEDMTKLLKSRVGAVAVGTPIKTPAEGLYQTQFGSKIAYLTGNGRYIIIGDMIDLQNQVNLTELSRRTLSKDILDKVETSKLAVFPSDKETLAVLNVFTDTSCPYCKKLHEEVPALQAAGIEVRYFPFPRGGAGGPGYKTLKQVWCSEDLSKAMDIAKDVGVGELPGAECEQSKFVDVAYNIGNQVGVSGTPALFTASGKKIDGYVPANRLIPMVLNRTN